MSDWNKKIIGEFRANEGRVAANLNLPIEVGTEKHDAIATVAQEPQRTRLDDQMDAQYPGFKEYRQKTSRIIPVITLNHKA